MRHLAIALTAFLLFSCGGGGGDSSPSSPVQPQRSDLLYGYFGSADDASNGPWGPAVVDKPSTTAETGQRVNIVMTGGWGDWTTVAGRSALMQQAVRTLQEAQRYGVTRAVLTVDFLLFDQLTHSGRYRGDAALTELDAFYALLQAGGVDGMVVALYPIDEPNAQALPTTQLTAALTALRGWVVARGRTVNLFSIYGPLRLGTPALALYDWIGVDDYDKGSEILSDFDALRSQLRPGQRMVLVPGGADPWRADPSPFLDYANAHADVVMIMPFVWFDGLGRAGIRSNPQRPLYESIGCRVRYGTVC